MRHLVLQPKKPAVYRYYSHAVSTCGSMTTEGIPHVIVSTFLRGFSRFYPDGSPRGLLWTWGGASWGHEQKSSAQRANGVRFSQDTFTASLSNVVPWFHWITLTHPREFCSCLSDTPVRHLVITVFYAVIFCWENSRRLVLLFSILNVFQIHQIISNHF